MRHLSREQRKVRLRLSGRPHQEERPEYLGVTFLFDAAVLGNWWRGACVDFPGYGIFTLHAGEAAGKPSSPRRHMNNLDVIGLGVSTLDIVTLVDHFPAGEEVQRAHDMTLQGGGPVATAIVALARLGARCAMLDTLGDDWRGALILDEYRREGVSTDFLRVVEGCTSAVACVLVEKRSGARTIVYLPGTTPELSASALPREVIEACRILHLNGRHWEACVQAARWRRAVGALTSFDGGAGRFRPEMRELVPLCQIAIVARQFAAEYTGTQEPDVAAASLQQEGPELVVITDGARGSWVSAPEQPVFHQPAYRVPHLVDTTGCGDAYHGAFLFGLLQGWDLRRIAAFASATAAINAQHLGGRRGLPGPANVEAFLQTAEPLPPPP